MYRLLLAEDDEGILHPLIRALVRNGYAVDSVTDGLDALERGTSEDHDLLVLDIGLPRLDGLTVCRGVRAARPRLPILILTAQDDELDTVAGLDAGADDYLTKPFRLTELLARVRALLRRAAAPGADGDVSARGVRVEGGSRRAWRDGREIDLTVKEFDLLALLVRDAGLVVSRERIMREVWDESWFGSTKTLDVHMSALRRKLGDDPAGATLLTTVRGVGFRFEA